MKNEKMQESNNVESYVSQKENEEIRENSTVSTDSNEESEELKEENNDDLKEQEERQEYDFEEEKPSKKPIIFGAIGVLLVVAIAIIFIIVSRGNKEEQPVQQEQQTQEQVSKPEEQIASEAVTEDTKEMETQTEAAEVTTLKGWIDTFDSKEPEICIWNEKTLQGKVIADNEEYKMTEGDQIVLYCPEKFGGYSNSGIDQSRDTKVEEKYMIVPFDVIDRHEVEMTITSGGKDYKKQFVLEAIDYEGNTDANTEIKSLEEWIEELLKEYDTPKIIVLNEATGTKKVLEDAEEYQLQDGDITAVYYPEGIYPMTGLPEYITKYEFLKCCTYFELPQQEKMEFATSLVNENTEVIEVKATFTR